jgi:hypothetical protein
MSYSEQNFNFTVDVPFSNSTNYYVLLDSVYGYISAPGTSNYSVVGDVDTYFVKTTPGYTYAMIVTEGIVPVLASHYGMEDASNPHINLYDSNGSLVKTGYDFGEYTGFSFYATDYTYLVDVMAPTTGGYTLTFVNNDVREENTAGEFIYVGNNYSAALDTASDIDKFAFNGSEGKRYYFDLTSNAPDMFYQFVDAYGEQLLSGTVDGSGLYYVDVVSSGVYDLQVSSNSFYGTGSYSFYFTDNLGGATFSNPTFVGELLVGETITSEITYTDPDGNSDGDVRTIWYLDNGDLTDGLDPIVDGLSGENSINLASDWAGKTLYFSKIFIDDAGNYESSVDLNADTSSDLSQTGGLYRVGVIENVNSMPTGTIHVMGATYNGALIQLDASSISDADGIGSFSYKWFRDNVEISGATSSEYMLASADVGASIYAVVSYTDGAGNLETISSSPTDKILPANDDVATTETLEAISALNTGSGTNISLDFYVDTSIISEDVNSFDMVVRFDSNGAEYVSADLSDFLGFPNTSGDTITLSGISLSGVSASDPLFTLNFTDLETSEDLTVSISDVVVNGTSLNGSTLLIGGPDTVDVATTVISRSGKSLSDVALSFDDGSDVITVNTNESGLSTASITSGSYLTVTGSLDYAQSSKSVTSQDALDALRLSVGMDTQSGTNTAFDYIAADFNQDGKVSSQDALAILKYAVGLPTTEQAEWVFVDSEGDYSGVSKSNTSYTEGVSIADLSADTTFSLTGILIGDVNDSYNGLIA